jgi:hypothetical protein
MPAVAHTLGPGSLALGDVGDVQQFEAQLTKALLSPNTTSEDDFYVLSGETVEGEDTTTWSLSGTVLQNFDLDSLEDWCFEHKGTKVPFVFTPSSSHTRSYSGIVKVRPLAVGGDVKKRNSSDFEFPLVGDPTPGEVV